MVKPCTCAHKRACIESVSTYQAFGRKAEAREKQLQEKMSNAAAYDFAEFLDAVWCPGPRVTTDEMREIDRIAMEETGPNSLAGRMWRAASHKYYNRSSAVLEVSCKAATAPGWEGCGAPGSRILRVPPASLCFDAAGTAA